MPESPRLCFITPGHIASNPRLVKEAVAAERAGYRVRVVFAQYIEDLARMDRAILDRHPAWDTAVVNWTGNTAQARRLRFWSGVRQKLAAAAFRAAPLAPLGARALCRVYSELLNEARRVPAALYVAHNLGALPVAAAAAGVDGRLGFDAEDFHRGELPASPGHRRARRLVEWAETRYMPRCVHLSAGSNGIAEAYASCLRISRPRTILNVFPLSERNEPVPREIIDRERSGGVRSLYWFSQTIGPGRGLEDAVDALAQLERDVHLYLRGTWAAGYEQVLTARARAMGVEERLHSLPVVEPHYLVRLAAEHDVGLALEQPAVENRRICLTNKLFTYMLAGVPVVATDTPAQRDIAKQAPCAVRLYRHGHPTELAAAVRELLDDPLARSAAVEAATQRFSWERESGQFLQSVQQALNGGAPAAAARA